MLTPKKERGKSELKIATLDIECAASYPGEAINTQFFAGGIYDGKVYREHRSISGLVDALFDESLAGRTVYAHNGSGYDFILILGELCRRGASFEGFRTGGRFFVDIGNVLLADSMCVLPRGLGAMAAELGVKTVKRDVPDDFFERLAHYWPTIGADYLRADCICLYECIEAIDSACRELGAPLQVTLASTAMAIFRAGYLDASYAVMPDGTTVEDDVRASYVGGNVQVFKPSIRKGACFDYNSSYPYEATKELPVEYMRSYNDASLPDYSFVRASVDVPTGEYIAPLHKLARNRLYFPTGRLEGWYTSLEIQKAIVLYGKNSVRITQSHMFRPAPILRGFVTSLYRTRLDAKARGNHALALACKLLMNSCYGKFGAAREREKIVKGIEYYHWPYSDPKTYERYKHLTVIKKTTLSDAHYLYAIPERVTKAPYMIPSIASWITAAGRMHLDADMRKHPSKLAYVDTDSLLGEYDDNDFETSNELGGLKLEYRFERARFVSPKCYAIEGARADGEDASRTIAKAKGFPLRNVEAILKFLDGEKVATPRLMGAFESLRRTGEFRLEVDRTASRQLGEIESKRHPDGRPWTVEEIEAMDAA